MKHDDTSKTPPETFPVPVLADHRQTDNESRSPLEAGCTDAGEARESTSAKLPAESQSADSRGGETPYDHDAECEEANHAELRKLRGIANQMHRQRNELLQHMRLILAATQSWNGGWVDPAKKSATEVFEYIALTAGNAIADIQRNGQ